jgi:futalosine hydrolase
MKILIVSATHFEIKPLLDFLGIALPGIGINNANIDFDEKEIQVLITGVGMVNTALMLGRFMYNSYDLALNLGICGAFDKSLKLGEVLRVSTDMLSELGAEDNDDFLPFKSLELPGEFMFSESCNFQSEVFDALKVAEGITVNTVHGNDISIEKTKRLFNPTVESMEGAAFFAACKGFSKNYLQVRSVSNYVERRDKSKWEIHHAIENLNNFAINFINQIPSHSV